MISRSTWLIHRLLTSILLFGVAFVFVGAGGWWLFGGWLFFDFCLGIFSTPRWLNQVWVKWFDGSESTIQYSLENNESTLHYRKAGKEAS